MTIYGNTYSFIIGFKLYGACKPGIVDGLFDSISSIMPVWEANPARATVTPRIPLWLDGIPLAISKQYAN